MRAAHSLPETLTSDAKAFIDAPENGGRYALHLSVKKPASLRIEALMPWGEPAAVLVADQGRFALVDLRNHTFYRGPSTPENLSRLLPAPLRDDELVALLLGGVPELAGAVPVEASRDGEGFTLVLSTVEPGSTTVAGLRDEIALGSDLRVNEVKRFRVLGARPPELLFRVALDEHDDRSGQQLPRLLHLSSPGKKTEIDLRLKDSVVGKPPPQSAFALGAPAGWPTQELR